MQVKRRGAVKPILIVLTYLLFFTIVVSADDGVPPPEPQVEPPIITETPTEIPTEPPTEIPTEVPTEAATEIPTETSTPEVVPTEEPTQPIEITPEATLPVESTPEVTPTVSPYPPEPILATLFTANFDDGLIAPELSAPGWVFVNTGEGQAIQSGEGTTPALYNLVPFAEGAVQARFLLNAGEARVFLRHNEPINYSAGLTSDGLVNLYRADILIQSMPLTLDMTAWHILRLSAFGGVLRVSVDGVEAIITADSEPLPPGGAGFGVTAGSVVRADDFLITVTEGSVVIPPPLEVTAEVTPELTPEATPEVEDDLVTAAIACVPGNISMVTGVGGNQPQYTSGDFTYWNADSFDMSADGRYIAYTSVATNLIAGDVNGNQDIFVFDRNTCTNERVSIRDIGSPFAFGAYTPSISDDGRYVAFAASDGGPQGIYVRDLVNDTTTNVAVGDNSSYTPGISGNGRYVVFYSIASDLIAGDTNNYCDYGDPWTTGGIGTSNCSDVYLYDLNTSSMSRVSITSTGSESGFSATAYANPNGRAAVSNDGRYVAFLSYASDMVPNDTNNVCDKYYTGSTTDNCPDVFLRDTVSNTTTLMSQSTSGTIANRGVRDDSNVVISADGQFVLFMTWSDNLVIGDNNNNTDAFLRDTVNNTTTRVALSDGGTEVKGAVSWADMSPDGNFVAFGGYAWLNQYPPTVYPPIAPNGPTISANYPFHIYVYKRSTQQTVFVSKTSGGVQGNAESQYPYISADGTRVLFLSKSTNLVAGDTFAGCEVDNADPYDFNENCPDLFIAPVTFPPPFLPPTALTVTGTTQTGVSLSWTDNTTTEQGFRIERSTNGFNWTQIGQVGVNATSFTDTTAFCGTSFMYRVRAYTGVSNSGYSNAVTGTTQPCVPEPCDPNAIIMRASTGSNGVPQGNGNSFIPYGGNVLSADGRYIVFGSDATNLVPGDTNTNSDIFRLDRQTCTVIRVSLADNEAESFGWSGDPSISADGRYVAFQSWGSNLVAGDTNNQTDIFVRDIDGQTTERVSINVATQTNSYSYSPRISADGHYVIFQTYADNLTPTDTNNYCEVDYASPYDYDENCNDVYLYDRNTDTLTLISVNESDTDTGSGSSLPGSVLVIGGNPYVIFQSQAWDLTADDVNGYSDVFIRNVNAGTTTLLSRSTAGIQANNGSFDPSASTDGTNVYVVFSSYANNLVSGDTGNFADIFLRMLTLADLSTGTTTRVSLTNTNAQANGNSWAPNVSGDSRFISFYSMATNLVTGDTNGQSDAFVRNVQSSSTARVSVSATGVQGTAASWDTSISANGLFIAFYSTNSNLVPGDTAAVCESDWVNPYDYNENCQDVFVAQNPLSSLKPPTGFTATALSPTSIRLNWTDGANETEYRVEHSIDNATWTEISVPAANAITFTHESLTCASTHYYRVRGYDASLTRYSSYTAPVSKATMACPAITAPVLELPTANAVTNDTTPTFTWKAVANSTSYELEIATNNTFTTGVQNSGTLVLTNYTPTTPLPEGVYFWRVRAYNTAVPAVAGGWSVGARSFTTDTTPINTITNLSAPANLAILSTARPTFSWTTAAGAGKYRLEVDEDSNFNTPEVSVIVTGLTYPMPVASQPLKQGLQNWRVLAIDPAGNEGTNWSATRSFTVFIGTAPNNGVFSATIPNFTWATVTGTTNYQFQLDNDTDFSADLIIDQPVTGTSFKPATLASGTYYWRVLRNGETPVDPNIRRMFFMGAAPAAPVQLLPNNAGIINDNTPDLTWQAVTPPAEVVVTGYKVTLATNSTFTIGAVVYDEPTTAFTVPTSLSDGIKYWKVQAVFAGSVLGNATTARSFTVDTAAPSAPITFSAPLQGSVITNTRPSLTWTASPTANRYRVDLAKNAGFGTLVLDDKEVTTPSLALTPANLTQPLSQGVYYWRVQAGDAAGNWSGESSTRTFTVFLGTAPLNGAFSAPKLKFAWAGVTGTTNYQLQVSDDTDFSDIDTDFVFNDTFAGNLTSYNPTIDYLPGTYYWRVVRNGETLFDPDLHFTFFVGTAPNAPALATPTNAAFIKDNTPDLTWNLVTPPAGVVVTGYKITIATNLAFTQNATVYHEPTTAFTVPVALTDGLKYWKVEAVFDNTALGKPSAAQSFTVDTAAPGTPTTFSAPVHGAVITNLRPTFSWTASPTANRYRIDLAKDAGFGSLILDDKEVTTPSLALTVANLPLPLNQGVYYWRVQSGDAAGNWSGESNTRTFTVFLGTAPTNGAFSALNKPKFTWASIAGTPSYTLEVSDDTDFSDIDTDFVINQTLTVTMFTPTTALNPGTYYWRVVRHGETLFDPNFSRPLFIGAAPAIPVLDTPINAGFTNDSTPDLTWYPVTPPAGVVVTGYKVTIATNSVFTLGVVVYDEPTTTFTVPSALTDGLKYWKVQAVFAGSVVGNPSLTRSFTVDTVAPAPLPNPTLPANAANITNTRTPTFTWTASTGAKDYLLTITGTSGDIVTDLPVTGVTYKLAATYTLANGGYTWSVKARDAAGNVTGVASTRTFTIALP